MEQRCGKCGAFINRVGCCPNCGQVVFVVDPVTKMRRKIEETIRLIAKNKPEKLVKISHFMDTL